MKKYIQSANQNTQRGYTPEFSDAWDNGVLKFTDDMNTQLKSIYDTYIYNPKSVLCGLSSIHRTPEAIAYIAYHENFSISKEDLLAIAAGVGFGSSMFLGIAVDYLTEINFHTEAKALADDYVKFAAALLLNKFNS